MFTAVKPHMFAAVDMRGRMDSMPENAALRDTIGMRRFAVLIAVLMLAVTAMAVPFAPPRAQAQTGGTTDALNFGDCAMRTGTGAAQTWANQICWIDTTGLTSNGRVTKRIGGYTLTFDVTVNTDAKLSTLANPSWSQAAFGKVGSGFFERTSTATVNDILQMNYSNRVNPSASITLSNISLTSPTGQKVPNPRFMVADAESTGSGNPGEMISVESANGGVEILGRVTPAGYKNACTGTSSIFGPAVEPHLGTLLKWQYAGSRQRDFVCYTLDTGTYGTFVTAADNPGTLEISMAADNRGAQAIALGLAVGRVSFGAADQLATIDTSFENSVTQKSSTVNFEAFQLDGTTYTPIPTAPNQTVPVIRRLGAGATPIDSFAFRSTITTDGASGFTRYDPVWSCTLTDTAGTSQSFTIREGSVPAEFSLVNNPTNGTSEVRVAAPRNRAVNCSVVWQPRFAPATLDLQKSVTGNAADFSDIQLRRFTLNYACEDVTGLGAGNVRFSQAYPEVPLTGSASLERGTTQQITNLPRGANCTVEEDLASAAAPPGTNLDLSWNTPPSGEATNPNNGSASYSVQLQDTNTGHAYNQYTYGTGTLVLSKEILGQPVVDGFQLDSYDFEVLCTGTNLAPWRGTITMSRTGTQVSGSTEVTGIPVGQDCAVRPLTDLSGEQRNQITFAGREVTVDGRPVEPDSNNAYHFTLPITEASRSEMHFRTSYDYILRDVFVAKTIDGSAAGSADLNGATYTVTYRCTAPTDKVFEGSVQIGVGEPEARIADIPVGSQCTMRENDPADTANTQFTRAVLRASDASDRITEVDNADGANTPVLTVWPSQEGERNLVTVINTYDYKLGTVSVTKAVNNNAGLSVPGSYTIGFTCGTRNIGDQAVLLEGSATINAGGTVTLTASNAAANDQSGAMGVPYGNTCEFTEVQPEIGSALIMSTDVAQQDLTVGAPTSSVTVTNTFTPAGEGLTISQSLGGAEALFPAGGISYELVCLAAQGVPDAPADPTDPAAEVVPVEPAVPELLTYDFTLGDGEQYAIDAAQLPLGSECTLTESSSDSLTRLNASGQPFNIDRKLTLTSADPSGITLGVPFTIGEKTVLAVAANYSYKPSSVSTTKNVVFDPATERYISEARKHIKLAREFPVTLVCTNPDGSPGVNINATITNGQTRAQNSIPEGSECTITEGATTTATGINLNTRVGVNTAAISEGNTASFTVGGGESVVFDNVYSRRLTEIRLEKIARLPGNVREQYAASGQNLQDQLYNHTFQLVCKDPETGDTDTLLTAEQAIKGEGSTTFTDVPVGADCAISGDNFGSLKLSLTEAGQELEAYLKPTEVDWVVDRAGGNAVADTELSDGTTQSPVLSTVDDAAANHVVLTNNYGYEYSTVRLDKKVTGKEEDLNLLTGDTRLKFAMQCKAIGYQTSTIGTGEDVIPASLAKADFDGTWSYSSPAAQVPAGSLCTFQEVSPAGLPQELAMTVTSQSNADVDPKQPAIATGRAPAPGTAEPTVFTFTDALERRTSPVGIALREGGYLAGAAAEGYTATITCNADGVTRTYPLTTVSEGALPTANANVVPNETVDLPVGIECEITFENSPALAARGQVEVVGGDRRPYMRYATWTNQAYKGDATALPDLALSDVPSKTYSTKFTVPGDASSTATEFVIGAEFYHPRAHYDVRLTKESAGSEGDGATFTFSQACGPVAETFELRAGGSHTISDVPVDSPCTVTELDDGNETVDPTLTVTETGSLIGDAGAEAGTGSVTFTALPTSGEDTSTSGSEWTLTALNSFPGIEVTKRIPGTPVSAITGAVADRAILADDATSFDVTYTVTNTGVFDAEITQLVDASLAGYTVTSTSGVSAVIGADGVIPAEVCAVNTLAPDAELSCTFTVDISAEPTDRTFSYFGEVEVTATSGDQRITATDGYGALRLTGIIGAMLPDTGMQTLVWLLVIGLLLFGFGAWRYLRRDSDTDTATNAEGGEHELR